MPPPPLSQDLGFAQCSEDLGVQQFTPELAVEAFIETVCPGAPRCDAEGFDPDFRQLLSHGPVNSPQTRRLSANAGIRLPVNGSPNRPYSEASALIVLVSTSSSGQLLGVLRCFDRCWPRTWQARRSGISSTEVT